MDGKAQTTLPSQYAIRDGFGNVVYDIEDEYKKWRERCLKKK